VRDADIQVAFRKNALQYQPLRRYAIRERIGVKIGVIA
jgi:hypothetical protein